MGSSAMEVPFGMAPGVEELLRGMGPRPHKVVEMLLTVPELTDGEIAAEVGHCTAGMVGSWRKRLVDRRE